MKRDLSQLSRQTFDVVVVGGGIHGACVARDAALRGMSVALVEQADFCSSTSHNSLKTIHGGIRYLQHLDFKRTIDSIREQQILRRTMGHLVHPLRFLMPNYGWAMRGPLAMGAGILMFEALTFAMSLRNKNPVEAPKGRLMGAKRCKRLAPGVDAKGLTGAGIWADAQVAHADKAVLQILMDATEHGAIVANNVRADGVSLEDAAVSGIAATDTLTGERLQIAATQVVNATGPWAGPWLESAVPDEPALDVGLVRSMNVVVDKPAPETAVAVKSTLKSDSKIDSANRMFFMVPWEGKTVIGTTHFTHRGGTEISPDAGEVQSFVEDFNAAYPTIGIEPGDVLYAYVGLTPGDDSTDADGAKLRESKVLTHKTARGLVSIISIKWTTARLVAEQVVDVLAQSHGNAGPCRTRSQALPDFEAACHETAVLDEPGLRAFVQTHVASTQAHHLADIALRRTPDVVLGRLAPKQLRIIVDTLGAHFDWSADQRISEVQSVLSRLAPSRYRASLVAEFEGVNL